MQSLTDAEREASYAATTTALQAATRATYPNDGARKPPSKKRSTGGFITPNWFGISADPSSKAWFGYEAHIKAQKKLNPMTLREWHHVEL